MKRTINFGYTSTIHTFNFIPQNQQVNNCQQMKAICQCSYDQPIKHNIDNITIDKYKQLSSQLMRQMQDKEFDENSFMIDTNQSCKIFVQILILINAFILRGKEEEQYAIATIIEQQFMQNYLIKNMKYFCKIQEVNLYKINKDLLDIIYKYSGLLIQTIKEKIYPYQIKNNKIKILFFLYSFLHKSAIAPILDKTILQNPQSIQRLLKDQEIDFSTLLKIYFRYQIQFQYTLNNDQFFNHQNIIQFLAYQESQQTNGWRIFFMLTLSIKTQSKTYLQICNNLNDNQNFTELIERKSFSLTQLNNIIKIAKQLTNHQINKHEKILFFLQWFLQKFKQDNDINLQKIIQQSIKPQIIITLAVCKNIEKMMIKTYENPQINQNRILTISQNVISRLQYNMISNRFQTFNSINTSFINIILSKSKNKQRKLIDQLDRLQIAQNDAKNEFRQLISLSLTNEDLIEKIGHILLIIFTQQCFRYRVQIGNKQQIIDAMKNKNFIKAHQLIKQSLSLFNHKQIYRKSKHKKAL